MTTPYEAIGGEAGVRAVLRCLYDELFDDPMVGFLFLGRDKDHIVEQQVLFTSGFLGGPQRYGGRALSEVHAPLPILPGHFDRRHHLLEQVLCKEGVPEDVKRVWLQIDRSLRASVLASAQLARASTRKP
jgi:truncated hemoglobin YjbI